MTKTNKTAKTAKTAKNTVKGIAVRPAEAKRVKDAARHLAAVKAWETIRKNRAAADKAAKSAVKSAKVAAKAVKNVKAAVAVVKKSK